MTCSRFGAVLLSAVLTFSLVAVPDAGRAAEKESRPFARVYLALRGCTSCAHCRTAIRQMAQSSSDGGEARVSTDAVEVRYTTPRPVPLRAVIRRLAENRLHDLSLVDVLFEAQGTIASGPDGAAVFTLRGTNQSFPVSLDSSLHRSAGGAPVRLTALVEGWREKGDLRLVARELTDGV